MVSTYATALPCLMGLAESTAKKIWDFKNLSKGWHYGEGDKFEELVLIIAQTLVQTGRNSGIRKMDSFPGLNGNVIVTFYENARYLECTVRKDLTVEIVEELNGAEVSYVESAQIHDTLEKIERFGLAKWATQESSIYVTGIPLKSDSRAQRSKAMRSLFSTASVPSHKAEPSVHMSRLVIEKYRVFPQYTGSSHYLDYPLLAVNSQ